MKGDLITLNRYVFEVSAKGVDAGNGILSGVSVITEGEVRGHSIYVQGSDDPVPMMADAEMLKQVKKAMEDFGDGGVKVKADHYTGFANIVGSLRNPVIDGTQLRADLHLLKKHPMFETIMELSTSMPGSFGLSISFSGVPELRDGVAYGRCEELYSVDLVDEPAANPTGLFSAQQERDMQKGLDLEGSKVDKARNADALQVQLRRFKAMTLDTITAWFRDTSKELTPKELETARADVTRLQADLAARDATITELNAKLAKQEADSKAAVTALEAKHATALAELEASVEKRASAKALSITQAQGQPPIPQTPSQDPSKAVPAASGKTGLARTQAAFEAKSQTK